MGLIGKLLTLVFGGGRNVVQETAEVFRENAEAGAQRAQDIQIAAMEGFQAEFLAGQRGMFDRVMDGINRLPRPAMALGCLCLFTAAMVDPVWFSERMAGMSLVPEPLWWLLGVVVSFYFGARHQAKGQEFQKQIAQSMVREPHVLQGIEGVRRIEDGDQNNPALADWLAQRRG
ncbi:holin (3TMs family) [Shimia isoporae]|uniref:Holin (3TMs family) n=1 Tax=Shimia isoporae TaxID=647720 RepID=A0A4R1NNA0_9RHOB|nr:holin family protein [Shimia isoporae]TCL09665.1 holin (3TMs family) [Shimia isoporae]